MSSKEISKAELYEIVYFHIELPEGVNDSKVNLKLYNDNGALSDDYMDINKSIEIKNRKGYVKLDLVSVLEKKGNEENKTLQKWEGIIDDEYGDEIELYWQLEYSKGTKKLDDKNLDMFVDKYCIAILNNKYRYTCHAGWIDKSHFTTTTQRNRIDIGATNLWKQILNENGVSSNWINGFQVKYRQDIVKAGVSIGVTKKYVVKRNLNTETKKKNCDDYISRSFYGV